MRAILRSLIVLYVTSSCRCSAIECVSVDVGVVARQVNDIAKTAENVLHRTSSMDDFTSFHSIRTIDGNPRRCMA